MGHFQVLFSGELAPGADTALVQRRVSERLGIEGRKISQLFSGRTVVLKSGLDEGAAFALQRELQAAGAITRVKDRTPVERPAYAGDRIQSESPQRRDATLKDITAAHFECPRCGFLQLEAEHCARCGVSIAQALRERRKEDLLIEKRIRELRDQRARTAAQHGRRAAAERSEADRQPAHSHATPPDLPSRGTTRPEVPRPRTGSWLRSLLPARSR